MAGPDPWSFTPPPLNATPEPTDSPFWPLDAKLPVQKAANAIDLADAHAGRICTFTRQWVPGHRLKYFRGKPYLDIVCPESHCPPPTGQLPGLAPQQPDYNGSILAAQSVDYEGPTIPDPYSFAPENPIG